MMLRNETRARARALQLLYAWELHGRPPIAGVATEFRTWSPRCGTALDDAEALAGSVVANVRHLDDEIALDAEHWRLDRIGAIERNILRLALREIEEGRVPVRVTINESVRLAHWFAGAKAPAFVNGVLDAMARRLGRL